MRLPEPGTIHFWRLRLDVSWERAANGIKLLSGDELSRLGRARTVEGQRSFLLSRSTLRKLLGLYLEQAPESVSIGYGPNGKPELPGLHFSISHSSELCVFAFARECEVGVDLEFVRPLPDRDELAVRFFSADETNELADLDVGLKDQAFFNCWTRKEAFLKAIGRGLQVELSTFQVTLTPDEEARIVQIGGSEATAEQWQVHSLEPSPGYTSALVYRGNRKQLFCFDTD